MSSKMSNPVCKFICVWLEVLVAVQNFKNLNFNELDRFFSSFQVPVNESARQVCHYLARSTRSV